MSSVETADRLTFFGAILSMVFGTIYLLWGIIQTMIPYIGIYMGFYVWIISGILAIIFGVLTLTVARQNLSEGDLMIAAIMCFIFGGITIPAIGGILTTIAGVLAIIAWNEQRSAAEVPPSPPSPPPPPPTAGAIYCSYCGAKMSPEAGFCPSCGKKVKK